MIRFFALATAAAFALACGLMIFSMQMAMVGLLWFVVTPIGFGIECRDRFFRWRHHDCGDSSRGRRRS